MGWNRDNFFAFYPYYNNPYSKEVQGPPTMQYNYEEGNMSTERKEADVILKRKRGVVDKLHERRQERMDKGRRQEATTAGLAGQKKYTQYNQQSNGSCVIM